MKRLLTTDTYYDITCDYCARHLSTDFAEDGMFPTKKEARYWAEKRGFVIIDNKNCCPDCAKKLKNNI